MEYVIGVDIGGTCTDCVLLDENGHVTVAKAFSTPPDFSQGVVDAVALGAEHLGLSLPELLRDTRVSFSTPRRSPRTRSSKAISSKRA